MHRIVVRYIEQAPTDRCPLFHRPKSGEDMPSRNPSNIFLQGPLRLTSACAGEARMPAMFAEGKKSL